MTDRTKTGETTPPSDLIESIRQAIDDALPESDDLTLAPSQIRRVAQAAYTVVRERIEELEVALRKALNFIENTEGELDIQLGCGDAARSALKQRIDP